MRIRMSSFPLCWDTISKPHGGILQATLIADFTILSLKASPCGFSLTTLITLPSLNSLFVKPDCPPRCHMV